jgi:drug/metabolite transporter (DMT)-like permease
MLDYLVNDSVLGPWQWVGALLLVGAILWISTRGVEANAHSEELGVRS